MFRVAPPAYDFGCVQPAFEEAEIAPRDLSERVAQAVRRLRRNDFGMRPFHAAHFALALAVLAVPATAASTPPAGSTNDAVRGDRAEGWLPQSRSPVIARNGIVTTSQPLAAQAGLRTLMQGGNAVDAAIATAAVLNVTEPMNVGFGGDLFAIVYVAKERTVHVLNASGIAPSGLTLARMNALGYAVDPKRWGPGYGMPSGGILEVTVPGAAWGWDEMVRRYGTMKLSRVLAPAIVAKPCDGGGSSITSYP